jgi:hypothetical protein
VKRFMRVKWNHDFRDDPVLIYSEIDGEEEVRKVEIYRDGHADFASEDVGAGHSILAEPPIWTPEEISKEPNLTAESISADEFEAIWSEATGKRA